MGQEQTVASAKPNRSYVSRLFGQYIIKNRLQFRFTLVVFIFLGLAAFTIWLEGHLVVKKMIDTGLVTDEMAINHLQILSNMIFYTSILALAITFGLSLFFSHFVAGPIYRFEKTFEQLKEGDLTAIVRLRKHDELKDTAEVINYALTSLRTNLRKERENVKVTLEKIRRAAEKLRKAGRTEEASELDQILFDIHNYVPHIKI